MNKTCLAVLFLSQLVFSNAYGGGVDTNWWKKKAWTIFNFECPAGLSKFKNEDKGILACKMNGKYHGPFIHYTGQGFISQIASMDIDVQVGESVTFFDGVQDTKGKIQSKVPFKNDKANGLAEEFFLNGKIKRKVSYIDGKKNGPASSYSEDGGVITEGNNQNDLAIGKWKIRNSDGSYGFVEYEKGVPKVPPWPKSDDSKSKELIRLLDQISIKRVAENMSETGKLCFETARFYSSNSDKFPDVKNLSLEALTEEISLLSTCSLDTRRPIYGPCLKKDGCYGTARFINEYEILQKVDDNQYSAASYRMLIIPGVAARAVVDNNVFGIYSTEKPQEGKNRLILADAGTKTFTKTNGFKGEFGYYYQINQVGLTKMLCRLKSIGDHLEKLHRFRCGYYTDGDLIEANSIQLFCVPYFQYDKDGINLKGSNKQIHPVDMDCN